MLGDFWHDRVVENDGVGLFLVLVGFILAFGFIRISARLMRSPRVPWWPGSVVSEGGVHLHHLVWGISAMMISGTLGFWFLDESPFTEICAALFGVGMGLTVDEFALWIYLDDVYWSERGRSSIDAMVITAAGMLLILLGFQPVELDESSAVSVGGAVVSALASLGVSFVCFAKQRVMHGAVGFLVFPIAVYGALRLGKPGSPWARRRYGARDPGRQARAEQRFHPGRRTERIKDRFRDLVGGETGAEYEAKLAARDDR